MSAGRQGHWRGGAEGAGVWRGVLQHAAEEQHRGYHHQVGLPDRGGPQQGQRGRASRGQNSRPSGRDQLLGGEVYEPRVTVRTGLTSVHQDPNHGRFSYSDEGKHNEEDGKYSEHYGQCLLPLLQVKIGSLSVLTGIVLCQVWFQTFCHWPHYKSAH